jgi:hypothetical protein
MMCHNFIRLTKPQPVQMLSYPYRDIKIQALLCNIAKTSTNVVFLVAELRALHFTTEPRVLTVKWAELPL